MVKQKHKTMNATLKEFTKIETLLKFTYGLIPIAAGADKFTNLLTDWSKYLSPTLAGIIPFTAAVFMIIVGIIEIIAGIFVFISPQKGGYLVSAWLLLIALNLLVSGQYLDVAVRDIAMAIGAFSLARISSALTKDLKS
jgi:hypothetical protein